MNKCSQCDYYSITHDACFHPSTWSRGNVFMVPGDPAVLNYDGRCRLYESVHPGGLSNVSFRLRNFFKRLCKFRCRRA